MQKALHLLTIEEAAEGLENASWTSLQLTEAALAHIEQYESSICSFVTIENELALVQAKASDERRKNGQSKGILDGIPYTLKDVYATIDSKTTASSRILEDWVAPYNATVYQKLQDAGAVLLGKTNTDEFTMGGSTETSYFGVTKNPWDLTRVSGGSSGGPAAAVAAHFGIFSIGTDTGGSIRQPASFCGVTGLRPTYGRISRFGELPMASSLDQTGPITKTVRDAAIVLEVLAGHDPLDATSAPLGVPSYLLEAKNGDLKGVKIGVPTEFFGEGISVEVEKTVRTAIETLQANGAEIIEVSLPTVLSALAVYYILCPAEVSSNMARYDGIHFGLSIETEEPEKDFDLYDVYAKTRALGLGDEVKRRIMLGNHVLSSGYYDAYYKQAQAVREQITAEFAAIFEKVDVLASPVSPTTAFPIGGHEGDPLAMYKEDLLTVPINVGGVPGMSIPCGFVEGLPVGLQLIAGKFKEENLFKVGQSYQNKTEYHQILATLISDHEK